MTRKHNRIGLILFMLSLILISVFSGCRAGPVGIFASIAQETNINANRTAAFTDANASFVGLLGSKYYAIVGTGKLYERTALGSKWNRTSLTSGPSDTYAQSAAVADGVLYVVFGIDNPSIYSYDGTDWSPITFVLTDEKIVRVLATDTQLFAITEEVNRTGKYMIYSYDAGPTFTLRYNGTVAGAEISLPRSVTTDTADFWFDGGSKVIKGDLTGDLVATTAAPPHNVTGVVYHDSFIYASTSVGRILKTADGSSWDTSPAFESSSSTAINFTAPSIVTFGSSSTTILLAGTSSGDKQNAGNGYYELTLALGEVSPRAISTATNFDTSLNGKSVIGMPYFVEGSGIRVFGLTIKDGLWSNYYNGTSWSGWARE